MQSFSVLVVACSLVGGHALPAPAVSGVVRDASGAPVAGATVRTDVAECQATTASDGGFSLECARPGQRLTVEAQGLRPGSVVAVDGTTRVTLDTATFADAVVVTATRGDGRTTSAAAPV